MDITSDIADARYVSLTSYRRNGEGVPVAVWIAPLGDGRVGFTTDPTSWKVKRIRANPAVTLRPCDLRGKVADGAPEVHGHAEVVEGPDTAPVVRAIGRKYGLQYRLVAIGGRIKRAFGRGGAAEAGVVITLDV